jgi:hypothetical protein
MSTVSWPATRKELYAAGYTRAMQIPARACKRCDVRIEFWHTPENKLMPIEVNPDNENQLLCHFNTCPNAEEFRRPAEKARAVQRELFK